MESYNYVLVICLCFCALAFERVSCTLNTLTTTEKPPMSVVETASLMKAARLKYGGEVPVEISRDLPREMAGENTCTRRSVRKYLGSVERNCTSLRPYPVAWCEGICFPQKQLSVHHPLKRYQEYLEKNRKTYECVPDRVVKKKVKIFCEDDQEVTVYRINVIKSCKCKQVELNDVNLDIKNNNDSNNDNNKDNNNNDNNNDNDNIDSMSISEQARRFGKRLHHLQNKLMLMKVQ